jgi:hypothetical protein
MSKFLAGLQRKNVLRDIGNKSKASDHQSSSSMMTATDVASDLSSLVLFSISASQKDKAKQQQLQQQKDQKLIMKERSLSSDELRLITNIDIDVWRQTALQRIPAISQQQQHSSATSSHDGSTSMMATAEYIPPPPDHHQKQLHHLHSVNLLQLLQSEVDA